MKKLKSCFIFLGFIILSWIIGEKHPFSRVPMYDKLPNWAYIFYLKDNNNRILFTREYYSSNLSTHDLGHVFYSYCQSKHIDYGFGNESQEELQVVGNFMLDNTTDKLTLKKDIDTIYLIRKYIFINSSGEITENDERISFRKI